MSGESSIISSLSAGKNAQVYRGILELVSRFGYISNQEVEYLFKCTRVTAMNRMDYLVRSAGILRKFDSLTRPDKFYSLTTYGREVVRRLALSDEMRDFVPSEYRLVWQNHHRQLILCFIAFRKIYGSRFGGWVSEYQLKKEYTSSRVVDGEFYLIDRPGEGNSGSKIKCWVELELSLKSPARYSQQFNSLAGQVYDPFFKVQTIGKLFFLTGSVAISERLKKHTASHAWGECKIYFANTNRFFEDPYEFIL